MRPTHGGGISRWIYIAIAAVVLALAATLTALRIRTRRVRRRGGGNLIEGARDLLQGRLDGLGETLAATAVGVSEREDLALTSHHRAAAETVAEVRGSIGRLDGPPAFRAAHGRLDDAEWHLGVVEAHLGQGGEPPRPESGHPARCFFNAEHGLATVEIELELPGVRTVSVGICAADAVRLSRGDEPEVGAVSVGRRRLPWAAAPTWYGGWGWGQDDLPSLRYHGQPVFSSSSQLDAFAGTTGSVSRVRAVTAAPAPPSDDDFDDAEPPGSLFRPDDEAIADADAALAQDEPAELDPLADDDGPIAHELEGESESADAGVEPDEPASPGPQLLTGPPRPSLGVFCTSSLTLVKICSLFRTLCPILRLGEHTRSSGCRRPGSSSGHPAGRTDRRPAHREPCADR